jgi:hypothetical protein
MIREKGVKVISILDKLAGKSSLVRNIAELADAVEEALEELIDIEYTGLYLYDLKTHTLKLCAARGFSPEERQEAELTSRHRVPLRENDLCAGCGKRPAAPDAQQQQELYCQVEAFSPRNERR